MPPGHHPQHAGNSEGTMPRDDPEVSMAGSGLAVSPIIPIPFPTRWLQPCWPLLPCRCGTGPPQTAGERWLGSSSRMTSSCLRTERAPLTPWLLTARGQGTKWGWGHRLSCGQVPALQPCPQFSTVHLKKHQWVLSGAALQHFHHSQPLYQDRTGKCLPSRLPLLFVTSETICSLKKQTNKKKDLAFHKVTFILSR